MNRSLALVLSGGGALAAYQAGFLRGVCRSKPDFCPSILTGVSAGAINAVALSCLPGSFATRVDRLCRAWSGLTVERVFQVAPTSLLLRVFSWGLRLISGGNPSPRPRSFLDNRPLREFLTELFGDGDRCLSCIENHRRDGTLQAVAVTASRVATGQSVTWVEGRDLVEWTRAHRISVPCRITIDHVMASAALPLLFPAVQIAGDWFCDGGVRLTAPLSPAIHLGAERILAISTRSAPSAAPSSTKDTGYPQPAELAGMLMSAVFLDQLDGDALRMQRINALIGRLPADERLGMRPIDLFVARPTTPLTDLSNAFEPELPRTFRFLLRGTGTRGAHSNELLSLLMFQKDYLAELLRIGEEDARRCAAEITALLT